MFHHRYCQQVVETWGRDFHSAPQERKISLLYLANDIMQNSKKDGMRSEERRVGKECLL